MPVQSSPPDVLSPLPRAAEFSDADSVRLELCAHNSLTLAGARWFFLSVCIGPLLTAGFCVLNGFWPVLPFAGLELGLLAFALRWSLKRGTRRERIVITQDFVTIQTQLGVVDSKTRFSRHWTTVKLRVPPVSQYPARLVVESKGQSCEVGSFLTEEERAALAVRLRQLVGGMNDSPRLETIEPGGGDVV